jgi:hypothetical protein
MLWLVKKKCELDAVEQSALDELQKATESLNCKQSMFSCSLYSFKVIAFL